MGCPLRVLFLFFIILHVAMGVSNFDTHRVFFQLHSSLLCNFWRQLDGEFFTDLNKKPSITITLTVAFLIFSTFSTHLLVILKEAF